MWPPVFSSVTLPLLRRNQGNIWLFEDSVLITGKPSGTVYILKSHFPPLLFNFLYPTFFFLLIISPSMGNTLFTFQKCHTKGKIYSAYIFSCYRSCFSSPVDASSRSTVQFPKSLLNLTDDSNVTSVKAYLTVPKLESDDGFLKTWGIVASKSGSW